MLSKNPIEKRLQLAGILLILGLLVEGGCLLWARPISFVIFVALGGLLLFCGIVLFLFSLVSAPRV
jgi:hypothetical protein